MEEAFFTWLQWIFVVSFLAEFDKDYDGDYRYDFDDYSINKRFGCLYQLDFFCVDEKMLFNSCCSISATSAVDAVNASHNKTSAAYFNLILFVHAVLMLTTYGLQDRI